ncbi:hypothetical protein H4R33_000475 [Dimargaris cristalligena]|uniref:Transmembrane protein n=1 Tax=Dimargaris cristalligena TaxID=215637 RepID=A0A4Q0A254_9FUNG|nr:hypothetical protein H4R33_000475 [Dimargaris cristalligena]RKP39898.1 hypothetical protein BJ085DRAFT_36047 [Dimargaris cristalligena]|eukprot:RKP39898.1 hypothetical protein BJ085DRAFT_36047 [Dimargaris cristalligena]
MFTRLGNSGTPMARSSTAPTGTSYTFDHSPSSTLHEEIASGPDAPILPDHSPHSTAANSAPGRGLLGGTTTGKSSSSSGGSASAILGRIGGEPLQLRRSQSIQQLVQQKVRAWRRYMLVRAIMWICALMLVWLTIVPTSFFLLYNHWGDNRPPSFLIYDGQRVLPPSVTATTTATTATLLSTTIPHNLQSANTTPPHSTQKPFEGVVVNFRVLEFSVDQQTMRVLLEPRMTTGANLTDERGLLYSDLLVDYYHETYTMPAQTRLRPAELALPIMAGKAVFYPFDRFEIKLSFSFSREVVVNGTTAGKDNNNNQTTTSSSTTTRTKGERIPTLLVFPSVHMVGHTFRVVPYDSDQALDPFADPPPFGSQTQHPTFETRDSSADLIVTARRQTAVMAVAILITFLMYILTIPLLALTVRSCWVYREAQPSPSFLVISGSCVLMLPVLRSLQPHIPRGICYLDFWGFIWNLIVALGCMISLLSTIHARYKPDNEGLNAVSLQPRTPQHIRRYGMASLPPDVRQDFRAV